MKYKLILILCFYLASFALAFGEKNLLSNLVNINEIEKKRKTYQSNLHKLEEYRKNQEQQYRDAGTAKKKLILQETRKQLENTLLQDIFPAWYKTNWAFHGTTTKPGEGSIACGYFVSTCLKQIGFKVERAKLAQQPSQKIIETLMDKRDRDIFSGGKPMNVIRKYLRKKGDGIYIVGLDKHVGFISVWGDDMAFIHSSYYKPNTFVKSENIDTKNPLSDSQYRVFGKLFSDKMILGWLSGQEYLVKANE